MSSSSKTPRFRRTRAFCAAFMLTLCLLLFGGGLLLADANTRAVTFGDGDIPYATAGGDWLGQVMGGNEGGGSSSLLDLLPARLRVLMWILEGERTMAQWLIPS